MVLHYVNQYSTPPFLWNIIEPKFLLRRLKVLVVPPSFLATPSPANQAISKYYPSEAARGRWGFPVTPPAGLRRGGRGPGARARARARSTRSAAARAREARWRARLRGGGQAGGLGGSARWTRRRRVVSWCQLLGGGGGGGGCGHQEGDRTAGDGSHRGGVCAPQASA